MRTHLVKALATAAAIALGISLVPGIAPMSPSAQAAGSGVCPVSQPPTASGGGFTVDDSAQLQGLRDDSTLWDDSITLTSDIDMDSCTWTSTIGDDSTAFTGQFDGAGLAITNIEIDVNSAASITGGMSVGLFGETNTGYSISHLHVEGVVSGSNSNSSVQVGGVVGYATGGVIERVTFTGTVTASLSASQTMRAAAGGLVGILWDDTVIESGVIGTTVVADKGDPYAGGLIGLAEGGSSAGLQTWVHDSFVSSSFVTAQDQSNSGGSYAGGLIGGMVNGLGDVEVENTFAWATVTVDEGQTASAAGGLVGLALRGSLDNSYAYATTTVLNPVSTVAEGRLVGRTDSDPTGSNNFWDSDIGGPATAIGSNGGSSLTGSGASEAALQTMSTFTNAGWAIVNIYEPPGTNTWGICEGQSFPYLLWQAATLPTPGNPCSTTPTITGTAAVGQTLVASFSTPLSRVIYRWWHVDAQGNETPLLDFDETYVVSATDIGKRMFVSGDGAENGIDTRAFSAPTAVVPDPTPPSPVPAGPPTSVLAAGGDRSVTVSWQAPASSGSFPVSQYQVEGSPSGSCLVPVVSSDDTQSCVVGGLVNGESYEFRVRALTGAGWGAWSEFTDPVTPSVQQSIVISGSRDGRQVRVAGVTTGLVGAQVTPWIRFPGPNPYAPGSGVRTVDADGEFTWQRRAGKKVYVYFRAGDEVRSNRVIIGPR